MKASILRLFIVSLVSFRVAAEVFVRSTLDYSLPSQDVEAIEQAGSVWLQDSGSDRNLRGYDQHHREMLYCNKWCQGFPCGQCYIWLSHCWEWCPRNRLLATEEQAQQLESSPAATGTTATTTSPPLPPGVRQLQSQTPECLVKIDEALLIMETAVSAAGEPIVAASHFLCFENIEGILDPAVCNGIESWNMWDSTTNSVSTLSFQDNPTICQSAMSQSNLEAVVSPACDVDWLEFTLVGPEGYNGKQHREYVGLYFLFSNSAGNIGHSYDYFPAGSYTVDATVKLDSPPRHESASLTFTVDGNC